MPKANQRFNPEKEAALTLTRLQPRLEESFQIYADEYPDQWALFLSRLEEHFPKLFEILLHLYSDQYDFFFHLESLLHIIA